MKPIINKVIDHLQRLSTPESDGYADALEDACTPRPPKPEWFGTGPGQWDSWWINMADPDIDPFIARVSEDYCMRTLGKISERGGVFECVPVAREGFPSPVGWHVVGG